MSSDLKRDADHKIALHVPPRATNAMLLLRRMEFLQSVTWGETAAVFARPAPSLTALTAGSRA